MTTFGPLLDVRPLLPRERRALLDLLGSLDPPDWRRATACPGWTVHDVVAHVVNDYVRRLAISRDGHESPEFDDGETLPEYIARINEEFVRAARQCSPRVLVDLLAHLGPELDALWATRDLDAPADLDVSWAATDRPSPVWLDLAREYTEFWVHQQQVRDAVSRPGADEPELFGPVIDAFLRALPSALRVENRPEGTVVRFDVRGEAGGSWHAVREGGRWLVDPGEPPDEPAARVAMDQDTLWRLATRGISVENARRRSEMHGDRTLTDAATTLLAIVR
ncbi:maleylpyruvate isomerase N-terminal domain-containing protein [Saccharopolyspora rosea]|uniref:maleylpyruvate isomerase N-terminal domain-containing protein n=1 Tax=Saccharopolyspora rosea TaxID=524884 RepID=UPI0021D88EA6|nr:maleylpyruvate isomerase N-terminal domain-containing protein [Saccharopolyspora rosea]